MFEGYSSHPVCVCVCVSVCLSYRASCYIPHLSWKSGALGFLCCSQRMCCVHFVENILFKSSGEVCWSHLPSSLLDEFLMDKRDSDGFFLRRLACRTNDRSYNSTDSSLVTVHYQQRLLACFSLVPSPPVKGTGNETKLAWVAKLLIRQVHGHAAYYVIVCNCTCAFYSASATTTTL